jgi:hypothetical protein
MMNLFSPVSFAKEQILDERGDPENENKDHREQDETHGPQSSATHHHIVQHKRPATPPAAMRGGAVRELRASENRTGRRASRMAIYSIPSSGAQQEQRCRSAVRSCPSRRVARPRCQVLLGRMVFRRTISPTLQFQVSPSRLLLGRLDLN